MAYTLADLEQAKAELTAADDAWANSSSNNPNKGQARLKAAREKVRYIEAELKRTGVLELSPKEKLEAELDRRFPDAKSREVVEFEGRRYRRRFEPLEKSRTGKSVTAWGKYWEAVE